MKAVNKASEENSDSTISVELLLPVLEQVASALSHDVRTPLRHTHHFLDFFENGLEKPLSDNTAENFDLIRKGVEASASMVETLISFARLNQRMDDLKTLDLTDLVLEAMYRTRMGLDAPDASLSVTGRGQVFGSEELLLSLFAHIFDNSVMFAPSGRTTEISVAITEISSDQFQILIEDNGAGFIGTPEAAFRLFQRGSRDVKGQGLGVGLPFARQIALLHSGSLAASDKIGKLGGAMLDLRLPKAQ